MLYFSLPDEKKSPGETVRVARLNFNSEQTETFFGLTNKMLHTELVANRVIRSSLISQKDSTHCPWDNFVMQHLVLSYCSHCGKIGEALLYSIRPASYVCP